MKKYYTIIARSDRKLGIALRLLYLRGIEFRVSVDENEETEITKRKVFYKIQWTAGDQICADEIMEQYRVLTS